MSTPEPGLVPETRGLPLVLRRLLDQGGVSLMVGKVVAVPDGKHVTVEVAGQTVVIPGLAGYVPAVGEGCWCLMGSSIVLAIGSASGTRPTTVPSGTVEGQLLVWNNTVKAWQGRASAPIADTLDSIDSLGFLQRKTAGGEQAWWALSTAAIANSVSVHPHGLGRVPSFVSVTRGTSPSGAVNVSPLVTGRDAANVTVTWPGTASGTAEIHLLVIG